MSKLAKKPIILPEGVEVKTGGGAVSVTGPKGELKANFRPEVKINVENGKIFTSIDSVADRRTKALWGTTHALLANMIKGVVAGYELKLEVVGVGYRAVADKDRLTMQLGYSHPVELSIPSGLEVKVEKNIITIKGIDKQLVGQFAAIVRNQRKPEPYKGKGIKYMGEVIRRKAGKVVKAVGG